MVGWQRIAAVVTVCLVLAGAIGSWLLYGKLSKREMVDVRVQKMKLVGGVETLRYDLRWPDGRSISLCDYAPWGTVNEVMEDDGSSRVARFHNDPSAMIQFARITSATAVTPGDQKLYATVDYAVRQRVNLDDLGWIELTPTGSPRSKTKPGETHLKLDARLLEP